MMLALLRAAGREIAAAPERFRRSFAAHTAAWLLFGLLLLAECGSYQIAGDMRRLCGLVQADDINRSWPSAERRKIDAICASREPADD